jgi:hypothetical protein
MKSVKYVCLFLISFVSEIIAQVDSANSLKALKSLEVWLATPVVQRPALSDQSFSLTPLTKSDAQSARTLLWNDKVQRLKTALTAQWTAKQFNYGAYKMKFDFREYGTAPTDGRSLYISMHGGGLTTTAVNDQQWANQIVLYQSVNQPKEGIYLAPRAPTDDWNMWFKDHIDPFFEMIIQSAIVFKNVNPNKVYLLGYSAGGDGAYQMGPRMADRWAAASAMAGHPNAMTPLNLRNIGFTIHMGGNDKAYGRDTMAVVWKRKLDSLQQADVSGYKHDVQVHAGLPHWMNLEDAVAFTWMAPFRRNVIPERIVWRQSDVLHTNFYWVGVPKSKVKHDQQVTVERAGQEVRITQSVSFDSLYIFLNDSLADLDKKVFVQFLGKQIFSGKVARTIRTMWESLESRADPNYIFSSCLKADLINGKIDNQVDIKKPSESRNSLTDNIPAFTVNNKMLCINTKEKKTHSLTLTTLQGEILLFQKNSTGNATTYVDCTQFQSGCYVVTLLSEKRVYARKLVLQ